MKPRRSVMKKGLRTKTRERGLTLVELMIAVTLSLILLTGLTTIFVNNSRSGGEIERANQQIENGRYAIQLLSDDLHNAGYLAEFDPAALSTPVAKPDPCAVDLATLASALPLAIQAYDNGASAPSCLSDVRAGTDILVVRRASTCGIGEVDCDASVSGAPYFQASGCTDATELSSATVTNHYALNTDTAALTRRKKDCVTSAVLHQYRTHIYFVANNDKTGDGIPTLKRAELGAGAFTIVPLVEGIENLQIEYGVDTVGAVTGTAAFFTANPDTYSACTGVACMNYWRNTVVAKFSILSRNKDKSSGYVDDKLYSLGLKADGTANTVGPLNDEYRRHLYQSVVRLNNVAGRNTP